MTEENGRNRLRQMIHCVDHESIIWVPFNGITQETHEIFVHSVFFNLQVTDVNCLFSCWLAGT